MAIRLGVAIELGGDTVGWLTGRSSTALELNLLTHEGKIDSGYRGEIHCICTALTQAVDIRKGDRICQLVVVRIEPPRWSLVDSLHPSARGTAGLGSTGPS